MGRYLAGLRDGLTTWASRAAARSCSRRAASMLADEAAAADRSTRRIGTSRGRDGGPALDARAGLRERGHAGRRRDDRQGLDRRGRPTPSATEYEVGSRLSVGNRLVGGAGYMMRLPTIDMAEVGAGGGSIAWLDAAGGAARRPAQRRSRARARPVTDAAATSRR